MILSPIFSILNVGLCHAKVNCVSSYVFVYELFSNNEFGNSKGEMFVGIVIQAVVIT